MSCRRPWRKWPWPWPCPWPWPRPWAVGPGAGREVMPLPAEPPAEPPAPDPPPTLVWLEVAALLACWRQKVTHAFSPPILTLFVHLKCASRTKYSNDLRKKLLVNKYYSFTWNHAFHSHKIQYLGKTAVSILKVQELFFTIKMKTSSSCTMLVATTRLQKTTTKGALDPFITVTRILGLVAH